jgi:hypothetical protein
MTDAAVAPRPDDAADVAPAAVAQPGDELDGYLKEFETGTSQPAAQPDHQNGASLQPTGAVPLNDIDALLDELSRPTASEPLFAQGSDAHQQAQAQDQFSALQSENAQLRAHMQRAADQRDLDRLSGELQSRLPSHLPPDYAAAALKSMAVDHPELVLAFDYRGADPRAVAQELRQIQMQMNHPATLPAQREMLQQHAQRLNIALHSKSILRRAMIEIRDRAESHRPIDEQATADHDAVAAAVRGRSGTAPAEPPPNFGAMSDADLRKYTREHFGF